MKQLFNAIDLGIGQFVARWLSGSQVGALLRESLAIGGWVAVWRPLEIFLYDWWPIRAEARLFDRLAAMPVRIRFTAGTSSESWQRDWPAVSPAGRDQGENRAAARD